MGSIPGQGPKIPMPRGEARKLKTNQNLKNKSFQLVTDAVGPWTTLLSNNINRVN